MMRYNYTMLQVPGRDLIVDDALSRQSLQGQDSSRLAEVADFEQPLIRNVSDPDVCLQSLANA